MGRCRRTGSNTFTQLRGLAASHPRAAAAKATEEGGARRNASASLSANLLSIQWALLPHELLQACVSDEIKMCRMLALDAFAPWHGGESSLSSLVVWLRQSNVRYG